MGRSFEEDPLTAALAPPPNETPAQREVRERAESEAKRVSDEIDAQLRRERESEKKRKPVKLLLLGQSESGKTATLKSESELFPPSRLVSTLPLDFQLLYCKRQWSEERTSWRCVILLNLVRNMNDILDILGREMAAANSSALPAASSSNVVKPPTAIPTSTSSSPSSSPLSSDSEFDDPPPRRQSASVGSPGSPRLPPLKFKDKHRLLRLRLAPLRRVQADLEQRLGAAATELYTTDAKSAAPFEGSPPLKREKEFSVHSTNGWKTALERFRVARRRSGEEGVLRKVRDMEDEVQGVIAGCREDMRSVWEDRVVREMLSRRKVRVEDSPGFFLNDVDRIARTDYQITDDDIIRARLRTVGVQEYRVTFEHGHSAGSEWRMYDVGGTRSSRAVWYSYFDDCDAIIFLAPVSCFDEKLAEDKRVNRLEDSYMLWKSVCACKLLARTQLVLFLNKCDLLQAKLMRGAKIRDSVPSFGDRRNDVATATRYFQQHFKEIQRTCSPVQRPFYVHLTSVIDTKSTAVTLGAVEESILRDHLRRADLM
ncbi:guanine nucleotide binding protein, alpha subunit [Mycena maculata]|uniref:Guanine nucleotide binding protein, alpha subunit n=1 Tax=Mycena maculata TaxID=230809 RepID=A0AAD7HXS8_9AGAR|nr:guanine nucleotide binding protein, alpha subunit [Mycena maculata]